MRASKSSRTSKSQACSKRSSRISTRSACARDAIRVVEPMLSEQWFSVSMRAMADRWRSRRCARATPPSIRSDGRTYFSTGWTTSTTGVSRASYGGAIAFPRTGVCDATIRSSPRSVPRDAPSAAAPTSSGRRRARHLVQLGPVAVLDPRMARAHARFRALLSDQPTVTGFDIIFFWVARMMMFGLRVHRRGRAVSATSTSRRWCATSPARR